MINGFLGALVFRMGKKRLKSITQTESVIPICFKLHPSDLSRMVNMHVDCGSGP